MARSYCGWIAAALPAHKDCPNYFTHNIVCKPCIKELIRFEHKDLIKDVLAEGSITKEKYASIAAWWSDADICRLTSDRKQSNLSCCGCTSQLHQKLLWLLQYTLPVNGVQANSRALKWTPRVWQD